MVSWKFQKCDDWSKWVTWLMSLRKAILSEKYDHQSSAASRTVFLGSKSCFRSARSLAFMLRSKAGAGLFFNYLYVVVSSSIARNFLSYSSRSRTTVARPLSAGKIKISLERFKEQMAMISSGGWLYGVV